MPDITTTLLVLRSHLRSAAAAFTGRSATCAYRTPIWQRLPLWVAAAVTPAWLAPQISDTTMLHRLDGWVGHSSYWYAVAAAAAVLAVHGRLEAWAFGGRHLHCDLCGDCSLNAGGRTFADVRNAVAFVISELGWFVQTRPGLLAPRVVTAVCGCDPDDYPTDYPFRPANPETA